MTTKKGLRVAFVLLSLIFGIVYSDIKSDREDQARDELSKIFSDVLPDVVSNSGLTTFYVDRRYTDEELVEVSSHLKSRACWLMTHPETKGLDAIHIDVMLAESSEYVLSVAFYESECS